MADIIYTCKEGSANKFWSYNRKNEGTVEFKWGRIGRKENKQTKTGSGYMLDALINKKVREKEKKGYELSSQQEYRDDRETAQKMGTQFKIQRMKWCSKSKTNLTFQKNYNPDQWVYIEVLNSWSKDVTCLALSKGESLEVEHIGETKKSVKYRGGYSADPDFVAGIRAVLKKLAQKVSQVVTVKFAAVGARVLSLTDDEDSDDLFDAPTITKIYEEVGETSAVSKQVVSQFAALGARVLEL